ncbi:MAG: hypothetical protein ACI976_003166 [Aureispira sp.]|jgi:hypothetical protein
MAIVIIKTIRKSILKLLKSRLVAKVNSLIRKVFSLINYFDLLFIAISFVHLPKMLIFDAVKARQNKA